MNFDDHFEYIKKRNTGGSNGWIQWKGTQVCIDIECPECKENYHIDAEFLYYFKCNKCNSYFALGSAVKLIKLPQDHIDFIEKDRPNLIHEEAE